MSTKLTPTMHKDYEVGTRVAFKFTPDAEELTGRIDGITFTHVCFSYAVTLDTPLTTPGFENWRVITVMGTLITRELEPLDDVQAGGLGMSFEEVVATFSPTRKTALPWKAVNRVFDVWVVQQEGTGNICEVFPTQTHTAEENARCIADALNDAEGWYGPATESSLRRDKSQ